jgi:hypothetical protein
MNAELIDCRYGEIATTVALLTIGKATKILNEMTPDVCGIQTLNGATVGQLHVDRVMLNKWTPEGDYDLADFTQARQAMWNIVEAAEREPYLKVEIA